MNTPITTVTCGAGAKSGQYFDIKNLDPWWADIGIFSQNNKFISLIDITLPHLLLSLEIVNKSFMATTCTLSLKTVCLKANLPILPKPLIPTFIIFFLILNVMWS